MVPGERSVEGGCGNTCRRKVRVAREASSVLAQIFADHAAGQTKIAAHFAVSSAKHRRVYGQDNRFAAGLLGTLNQVARNSAFRRRIKLKPDRVRGTSGNFFDRNSRERACG